MALCCETTLRVLKNDARHVSWDLEMKKCFALNRHDGGVNNVFSSTAPYTPGKNRVLLWKGVRTNEVPRILANGTSWHRDVLDCRHAAECLNATVQYGFNKKKS